ncbi:MAG: hypothetical protein V1676_01865 [Candidatus Diapherotrites archaeon]
MKGNCALLFFAALAAIILLSGCPQPQELAGQQQGGRGTGSPAGGSAQMTDEEKITARAVAAKDTAICNEIAVSAPEDAVKKQHCYEAVWEAKDTGIPEKALAARDPAMCEQLSDNSKRDNCVSAIAVAELDEEICERILKDKAYQGEGYMKEMGKSKSDFCKKEVFTARAVAMLDASICEKIEFDKELSESTYRNSCIRDVANAKKDPAICDLLSDDSGYGWAESCYYDVASESGDGSLCKWVSDEDARNHCKALATGDSSYCEALPKESTIQTMAHSRNTCYNDIAERGNDEGLCRKMDTSTVLGESGQANCFITIAVKEGDVTMCNNISSQQFREGCVQRYNLAMCNKIESAEGRQDCTESLLGRNQSTEDKEIYSNAISKEDMAECGKISDAGYKQKCKDQLHFNKAITERNAAECDLMSDSSSGKGSCYYFLVVGTGPHHGDKSLCGKIPDREDVMKRMCMEP